MSTKFFPQFGADPFDNLYCKAISEQKTKLTRLFRFKPRAGGEKPGRSLRVVWDARQPAVAGFENNYSYTVTFHEAGNIAGNHYHAQKQELFYPVVGRLTVILEDIKTKEREEIILDASEHVVLFIPVNIAHAVVAESAGAVLLVIADFPDFKDDHLEYKLRA